MLTPKDILQKLEARMDEIDRLGVKKIGLFGSYLRDEQKSESDIDILVEFKKGRKTFDNYMNLKFFLEDLLGSKVDLVIAEAVKPDLRQHIFGSVRYASGI